MAVSIACMVISVKIFRLVDLKLKDYVSKETFKDKWDSHDREFKSYIRDHEKWASEVRESLATRLTRIEKAIDNLAEEVREDRNNR